MTLWGGRFKGSLDRLAWSLNASIGFDQRMAAEDVQGNLAWARALEKAGVLTVAENASIQAGLERIGSEFENGQFEYQAGDEDIHTAVERRLGELIGPLAGKLHSGRSRNDQVATDLRLWCLNHIPDLEAAVHELQTTLLQRAEQDLGLLMPGYTHLQRAQPILLSHWWLWHFWPLQRDLDRLAGLARRTASLPLGSAALAGTTFAIDRLDLAQDLGFEHPAWNSLDAVSDRDFVAEFLFCATLVGSHLSRLAEAVVLFTTAEFGYFELADEFATGSSLMPQKKNPDVFELTRGKAGSLIGLLTGFLAVLKGLPSIYDKDLQEDKVPLFTAYDTVMSLLPVLAGALETLQVHPERMRANIDASMFATELADYLVKKGVPFREAHFLVGKAVQAGLSLQKPLDQLSLADYQAISPVFDADLFGVLNPEYSIAQRDAAGGTALPAVQEQIQKVRQLLQG